MEGANELMLMFQSICMELFYYFKSSKNIKLVYFFYLELLYSLFRYLIFIICIPCFHQLCTNFNTFYLRI